MRTGVENLVNHVKNPAAWMKPFPVARIARNCQQTVPLPAESVGSVTPMCLYRSRRPIKEEYD